MTTKKHIQIQSDGTTVWVHCGGETIARFGMYGIDIHNTILNQMNGQCQCLFCSHTKTTFDDWKTFVEQVKKLYQIEVSESYTPIRFLIK